MFVKLCEDVRLPASSPWPLETSSLWRILYAYATRVFNMRTIGSPASVGISWRDDCAGSKDSEPERPPSTVRLRTGRAEDMAGTQCVFPRFGGCEA